MLMSYNLNDEHQCFSEENLSETEDVERRRCCVFQVFNGTRIHFILSMSNCLIDLHIKILYR